jgi:hypothetical protein
VPPHAGASLLSHDGGGSVVVVVEGAPQSARHDATSSAQAWAASRAAEPQSRRQTGLFVAPRQSRMHDLASATTDCAQAPSA